MDKFAAKSMTSFRDLMTGVLKAVAKQASQVLERIMEELDEQLEHPGKGWESIGKRERRLVSLFGVELVIRRRGYRRRVGDKTDTVFPLDEVLGLRPEERFCPLVQEWAIELATKMSFREAAGILQGLLQVPVSHQQVHRWVEAAGGEREREEREKVQAVFGEGRELKHSDREVAVLVVEADGVCVPLQREREKVLELKLGVVHEGWRPVTPGGGRYELIEKACWGGDVTAEEFWERGVVRIAEKCDPTKVQRVILNGDGAAWIREGQAYLGAEWYLDRYHVHQAVLTGLSHDGKRREQVFRALAEGNLKRLEALLDEAVESAKEPEHRRKAEELRVYLKANWEGLEDWRRKPGPQPGGAKGLGAMEGQVRHLAAARMKRRGASWSRRGANHMVQLRLLDGMERLGQWLQEWQERRWPQLAGGGAKVSRVVERLAKEDPEEWLRACIPALRTAFRSGPLGRALYALSHIPALRAC